jgi:hypothetical protein
VLPELAWQSSNPYQLVQPCFQPAVLETSGIDLLDERLVAASMPATPAKFM